MAEPVVRNAADESQVAAAEVKEKLGRDRELNDLCVLLAMPEGRRFIWRLLEQAKIFKSIWEPSARIHYLAGRQDFGHFLLAEVLTANEGAFFKMMSESRERNNERPHQQRRQL